MILISLGMLLPRPGSAEMRELFMEAAMPCLPPPSHVSAALVVSGGLPSLLVRSVNDLTDPVVF